MSYILEALKKAQAERQLGNAPDIHTPAPVPVPAASAAVNRKPLLIGLGVGVLVAGIAAGLVWRAKTPAGQPAVLARNEAGPAAPAPAAAPAASKEPAAAPVAAPAPVPEALPASAVPVPAPAVQPARRRSEPVAAATPAAPPPADTKPRRAPAPAPAAARDPAPEAVYLPAPTPPAPPPTRAPDPIQEENLRTLQQLPEAIQREVPKVAVGGYIYSPNPADRLLLVDKMLRREGEELAPGLVLERLMPKYAVMNYRGTRYRVAY
ncbi:general secretion pathway protein GspB [Massilia litorea]|uniref:General secretion pathway protein GspB n=1 Tax=Massilia litorea TaxID=2769491 RepID=A0A7L9U3Q3_9BURK|nr:general secretion pathway protein GspB [Massilia litorea]QOL49644.1 general secretion pathway protein GspB [Massilia litorea]